MWGSVVSTLATYPRASLCSGRGPGLLLGGGVSSHPRSRYSQIREHRATLHLGCEVAELALRPRDGPSQVNK